MDELRQSIIDYIKPQLGYDGSDCWTIYLLSKCDIPFIESIKTQLNYVSMKFLTDICGPNDVIIKAGDKELLIELQFDNEIIIRINNASTCLTYNQNMLNGYINVPPGEILNHQMIRDHVKDLIELGDAIRTYYTTGIQTLNWEYHNQNK